jgi:hypothetical protein
MGEAIQLPHGFWLDGHHCREVILRAFTGRDEEFVNEQPPAPPVVRATELLLRCIQSMEGLDEVDREAVERLVMGDREALLWQLRRLTLGERLQATLTCPAPGCSAPMDLELSISDLLQSPYPDASPNYETEYQGRRLRFRLPTGADLTALCDESDSERAVQLLLRACLEDGVAADGSEQLETVADLVEALDPQAELRMEVRCPECGESFTTLLDATRFLLQEIAQHADDLYRQIHSLALHYHWSEAEILALSPIKRRRYLELLADSLSESQPL